MRKATFLVAAMLAAVLSAQSNVAAAADDLNQNTHNFIRDALNPYRATAQPSSGMHHMHGMHHHSMHHHGMHHGHHHMHRHGMHHRHHMMHGKM
jgi:hypothetical protein